jgi:hypothetical protein
VERKRFEHPPETPRNLALRGQGGAESGAPNLTKPDIAPELAALVESWPRLPEHIKDAIRTLLRVATG